MSRPSKRAASFAPREVANRQREAYGRGVRRVDVVLQRLGAHIANALERAAAAERRAADTSDPEMRLDNERMAESWRLLARSFQFVETLEQFLIDSRKNRNLLPPKPPDEE